MPRASWCNWPTASSSRTVGGKPSGLGSRVKLSVDLFETRHIDVGVDLSGRNAGVAEHLLDSAQIGTTC